MTIFKLFFEFLPKLSEPNLSNYITLIFRDLS